MTMEIIKIHLKALYISFMYISVHVYRNRAGVSHTRCCFESSGVVVGG